MAARGQCSQKLLDYLIKLILIIFGAENGVYLKFKKSGESSSKK